MARPPQVRPPPGRKGCSPGRCSSQTGQPHLSARSLTGFARVRLRGYLTEPIPSSRESETPPRVSCRPGGPRGPGRFALLRLAAPGTPLAGGWPSPPKRECMRLTNCCRLVCGSSVGCPARRPSTPRTLSARAPRPLQQADREGMPTASRPGEPAVTHGLAAPFWALCQPPPPPTPTPTGRPALCSPGFRLHEGDTYNQGSAGFWHSWWIQTSTGDTQER